MSALCLEIADGFLAQSVLFCQMRLARVLHFISGRGRACGAKFMARALVTHGCVLGIDILIIFVFPKMFSN